MKILLIGSRKPRARDTKYLLASDSSTLRTEKHTQVLAELSIFQTFVFPVEGTEWSSMPPLGVHYHLVNPGPFHQSKLTLPFWRARQEDFRFSFIPKVNAKRKDRASASLWNIEGSGELVRIATDTASACGWPVNVFGVARTDGFSDPFDKVNPFGD
jgi:hypothetical protein